MCANAYRYKFMVSACSILRRMEVASSLDVEHMSAASSLGVRRMLVASWRRYRGGTAIQLRVINKGFAYAPLSPMFIPYSIQDALTILSFPSRSSSPNQKEISTPNAKVKDFPYLGEPISRRKRWPRLSCYNRLEI